MEKRSRKPKNSGERNIIYCAWRASGPYGPIILIHSNNSLCRFFELQAAEFSVDMIRPVLFAISNLFALMCYITNYNLKHWVLKDTEADLEQLWFIWFLGSVNDRG